MAVQQTERRPEQQSTVQVMPVMPEGWTLRDRSRGEGDPAALLGYVQRDGSGFEAVWLAPVVGSERFGTLASAIEAAARRCGGAMRRRP